MRYWLIAILLCSIGILSALSLEYPSGNIYEIMFSDIAEANLHSVQTMRSSEGGMTTETWRGLSLKAMLEEAGETDWDIARILSKDNYESTVNRVELDSLTAILALYRNGQWLSEYDVRVVFPSGHESTWIRNLKSISMDKLQSLPPLQIMTLDMLPAMAQLEGSNGTLSMDDLVLKALRLSSAEIVVFKADFSRTRYSYPTKQQDKYLIPGPKGQYYWRRKELSKELRPEDEIVYLQCGNMGFISEKHLQMLPRIGSELGWNWGELQIKLVKNALVKEVCGESELFDLQGAIRLELK